MPTRLTPRLNAEELIKANLLSLEKTIEQTRQFVEERNYTEAEHHIASLIQQSAGVEMWINTLKTMVQNQNKETTGESDNGK